MGQEENTDNQGSNQSNASHAADANAAEGSNAGTSTNTAPAEVPTVKPAAADTLMKALGFVKEEGSSVYKLVATDVKDAEVEAEKVVTELETFLKDHLEGQGR